MVRSTDAAGEPVLNGFGDATVSQADMDYEKVGGAANAAGTAAQSGTAAESDERFRKFMWDLAALLDDDHTNALKVLQNTEDFTAKASWSSRRRGVVHEEWNKLCLQAIESGESLATERVTAASLYVVALGLVFQRVLTSSIECVEVWAPLLLYSMGFVGIITYERDWRARVKARSTRPTAAMLAHKKQWKTCAYIVAGAEMLEVCSRPAAAAAAVRRPWGVYVAAVCVHVLVLFAALQHACWVSKSNTQ